MAWRYVAYARQNDAAGCEDAARQVDDLARPFAGERDFELQRAEARRYIAYARRNDATGCERAARQVDDLARPFAGERDFEMHRAVAWRWVAYARRDNAAGCESAARQVDDVARPFAGERDFEEIRSAVRVVSGHELRPDDLRQGHKDLVQESLILQGDYRFTLSSGAASWEAASASSSVDRSEPTPLVPRA